MAYTTINKSTDHFNTLLYTGNDTDGRAITGVGFQPDWVWFKGRNYATDHEVFDPVRGVTNYIITNGTNVQASNSNRLQSFDSDGFTLGNSTSVNKNYNYVAWNWKAGNSAGSSNSDGNLTSTVSANTTAGFSIVKYTSDGSGTTIGHGLGVEPNVILLKNISDAENWVGHFSSIHSSSGNGNNLYLNLTNADSSDSQTVTARSATTFTCANLGGPANASSAKNYIAYCFAEKKGFSKFGKYTGNGNADGTFIYTGFKPAFLLSKMSSGTQGWFLVDNKRENPFNPVDGSLHPNSTAVEDTSSNFFVDFTSNGFKLRDNDAQLNGDGSTYVYMAFAEAPFVGTNNIPATAR